MKLGTYSSTLLCGLTSFALMTAVAHADEVKKAVDAHVAPAKKGTEILDPNKRIEKLEHQVSALLRELKKSEKKVDEVKAADDKDKKDIAEIKEHVPTPFEKGKYVFSNENVGLRLSGNLKLMASYYPGTYTNAAGDSLNTQTIPLKGVESKAARSGYFTGNAQLSQIQLDSVVKTKGDDINGRIQIDFQGVNANGMSCANTPASGYGLQVRQAYLTWGNWLVGQNETNFLDPDSNPNVFEGTGVPYVRLPQLRYTKEFVKGVSLSSSAEVSDCDYIDQNGDFADNSKYGKQNFPNLTTRLRFEGDWGSVAFSGLVRFLQARITDADSINDAKNTTATASYNGKATGWGLGTSFKLMMGKLSNVFGQANYGYGIGGYIGDAIGQSAYFQVPSKTKDVDSSGNITYIPWNFKKQFDLIGVTNLVLGTELWWTEKFRTMVFGSYTKFKNPKGTYVGNKTPQINTDIKKVTANAIYSPVEQMDIGIEFIYAVRNTLSGMRTYAPTSKWNGATGKATQISLAMMYRF